MPKSSKKLELFFIFDKFEALKTQDIFAFLPDGYCTLSTLYQYRSDWNRIKPNVERLIGRVRNGIRKEPTPPS